MKPRHIQPAILLLSAACIAYQIVLMRVFAVAQWHHFAYMAISVAMLGFGASGTALALGGRRVRGKEALLMRAAAWGAAVALPGCYALSQRIPFDTFRLIAERTQFLYLLGLYLTLAAPFFLVAAALALGFMANPAKAGWLYGVNMTGSGVGALGAAGLLHWAAPQTIAWSLGVPCGLAAFLLTVDDERRSRRLAAVHMGVTALGCAMLFGWSAPIRVSEYKALSYALDLPDARVVAETHSPFATVTAVRSEQIRETPGQVSGYPWDTLGPFPEQIGLFYDAGSVSPVHRFDGDLGAFAFLDYVTSAMVYRIAPEHPHVCVLGAGGGTDVLSALHHGAEAVTAVEVDPQVLHLVSDTFADFSGGLYRRPDVRTVAAEGRGFLASSRAQYDVIHVPLSGAFSAAAAGVLALNESYLYTVEAFTLYLSRLTPDGVLVVNCWLQQPPRDAIRLFATAVEACERFGMENPARHAAFARSWNNATICVSRSPLTDRQTSAIREFCVSRGFDLCYLPGLEAAEANRFILVDHPVLFEAAHAILSPDRDAFYRDYVFDVRPATDDRPHFFRYFKWASVPRLIRGMGQEWMPFVEWGYVALVATAVQSGVMGALLLVLPWIIRGRGTRSRTPDNAVLVYFGCLGLAYMFLEIAFIQKFMFFLAYPVYAVTVVLTSFLVFSGVGALCAGRAGKRPVRAVAIVVVSMALLSVTYLLVLPYLFRAGAAWPDGVKIAVSIGFLAPLAFSMGIPFPKGLQWVSASRPDLVPWAWAANGCTSVLGASLATLLAVHAGFMAVVFAALAAYGLAAGVFARAAARPDAEGDHRSV